MAGPSSDRQRQAESSRFRVTAREPKMYTFEKKSSSYLPLHIPDLTLLFQAQWGSVEISGGKKRGRERIQEKG